MCHNATWCRLDNSASSISSLTATSQAFINTFAEHQPDGVPERIYLYVDGTGGATDVQSAWAVVAVEEYSCETFFLRGVLAGQVVVNPGLPQFIGADSTGVGAAELSAQTWASCVGIMLRSHPATEVWICYDSEFAAAAIQAQNSPTIHVALADIGASAAALLATSGPLYWHHVKSHSGHPLNDMVDAAADHAGRYGHIGDILPWPLGTKDAGLLGWAAIKARCADVTRQYPSELVGTQDGRAAEQRLELSPQCYCRPHRQDGARARAASPLATAAPRDDPAPTGTIAHMMELNGSCRATTSLKVGAHQF